MKSILLLLLAMATVAISTQSASAQRLVTIVPTKDSCQNVDNTTIRLAFTTNQVVAFHMTAVKVSGTVAGTAQLQGSLDGTNWINVGSAVNLTDVALNTVTFEPARLSFRDYRILVTTSGTCKIKPIRGYWLSRQ